MFPLRPFGLLSKQKSPAKTLTYWHRPHTSKIRLPILFIHGIGIGLYPYINFLSQINRSDKKHDKDGGIGIIAIEIMPVSFRITGAALERDQMCGEILQILRHHGWHECILASHSYGSVISSHLLQYSETSELIGPVLLIDPVSILLHLPDVAYNFTARKPIRANEYQLYCEIISPDCHYPADLLSRFRQHGHGGCSYLRKVSEPDDRIEVVQS